MTQNIESPDTPGGFTLAQLHPDHPWLARSG